MNQIQPYHASPAPSPQSEGDVSLKHVAALLKQRRKLIAFVMIVTIILVVGVSLVLPKRWTSEAQIVMFQRQPMSVSGPGESYTAPVVETIDTQMGLMGSDPMTMRTLDWVSNHPDANRLYAKSEPNEIFDDFQRDFTFDNPKDTNIVTIMAEGVSPREAQMKANALCSAFIAWKTEMARHDVSASVASLTERADAAHQRLTAAERDVTEFKIRHNIVDTASQDKALLDHLALINADLDTARQTLHAQTARRQALQAQLHSVSTAITSGGPLRDDTLLLSLQTQLTAAESERANAALQYRPKYPGVLPQLDAKIAGLKQQIAERIKTTVAGADPSLQTQSGLLDLYHQALVDEAFSKAHVAASRGEYDALHAELAAVPQRDAQYIELSRRADILSGLFGSLTSALNEAKLDLEKTNPDVQLSQAPILPDADDYSFPRHKIVAAVALLLSVVFATLAVAIAENSNPVVRDVDRIRDLVPGLVVGTMLALTRREMKALDAGVPSAAITEIYNMAIANMFIALQHPPVPSADRHQVILVTSALPGEGKSTTAAHLSRAIAAAGRRVILIDADLRRDAPDHPRNLPGAYGFGDVLSGKADPADALMRTDTPNLSCVSNWGSGSNPIGLIAGPRTADVLQAYRTLAEVVVIDTPACALVADALFLVPYADCVLHIVGAGKVSEAALTDAVAALEAAAPSQMMFLINHAAKDQVPAYRSYRKGGYLAPAGRGRAGRGKLRPTPSPRAITFKDPETIDQDAAERQGVKR